MKRIDKVNFIKEHLPEIYPTLKAKIPNIFKNPNDATTEDIILYNQCLETLLKHLGYGSVFISYLKF